MQTGYSPIRVPDTVPPSFSPVKSKFRALSAGIHLTTGFWLGLLKRVPTCCQNYFTTLNPSLVRKLTNKKIRWIIRQLNKGTPVKEIAAVMRVTPRRIYQIKKQYEETGKVELKHPGREPKQIDQQTERIVLEAYQRYKLSPVPLEKLVEVDYNIHLPHNTIYRVLLKHNLVEENINKKKRRKRVRYERTHSMSLWQGDWKRLDDTG